MVPVCLQLGVDNTELNTIDANVTPKNCTYLMLTAWINQEGENATIEDILRSDEITNGALARRLEENEKVREILKRKQFSAAAGWFYCMLGE